MGGAGNKQISTYTIQIVIGLSFKTSLELSGRSTAGCVLSVCLVFIRHCDATRIFSLATTSLHLADDCLRMLDRHQSALPQPLSVLVLGVLYGSIPTSFRALTKSPKHPLHLHVHV